MTLLITGATGFLGVALVERLLARGERDLRCLLRAGSEPTRIEALARRYPDASVELHVGSLGTAAAALRALDGVTVVYHLAAALRGAAADMFLNTVVTSKNLLVAIATTRRPIKVVLVSSLAVYGVVELARGAVVDESTPLEPHPTRRDLYAQVKLRQEQLARDLQAEHGLPLVVVRPGVIYGARGPRVSSRVGLDLAGVFLSLGGDNPLPLTYVDNCADAIVIAGQSHAAEGESFNVIDDDLPTCRQYLARYREDVERLRTVPIPYPLLQALSAIVERYHAFSKGQLPAIFTPYKTAASWKSQRFTNAKLKSLGWRPLISTHSGMQRAFHDFKSQPRGGAQ